MSKEIKNTKAIEARKKLEEINKGLAKIERKNGKIEVHLKKEDLKKGYNKVIDIVKKMVEEDTDEYREVGDKKIGNVRVQHGLKIRFLDDKKDKKIKR